MILLLLFIILVLLFSIPAVQTGLGKYATERLNEDFGTNITIEKVGLQFNGDVELKNIHIEDHHQDTLIFIQELNTSILSFKKLYDNKLTFGDIDIEGLKFNLKTYKDESDTNLDVFVAKFDDDQPRTGKSDFLMSSSDVSITDGTFILSDENKEDQEVFKFENLNLNATDFLILGPDVSARINKLGFKDSRGVVVENMITNFTYTLQSMTFDYLQIKTANSLLKGDVKFTYNREDMQYFVDRVKINAVFTDSDIALDELNAFYNEFGKGQRAKLNATLFGTLNDLSASNLDVRTSRQSVIRGTLNFKNLFNAEEDNFVMDGSFENLSSNYRDLRALLPNVLGNSLPSSLDKLGRFTIKGDSKVTSKTVNADIDINTDLGYIISDLELNKIDDIDDATYTGKIILDEFALGTFINDPEVGTVSANLDVDGKGFTIEKLNTRLEGELYNLGYNSYDYTNLQVSGNVQNKVFNGNLVAKDPNFDLEFNGLVDFSNDENIYDFTANVNHANLKALNFVSRDSMSVFKGLVKIDMKGTDLDDAYGNISFKNTYYKNQNDDYYFKDFAIASRFENDIRYISVNSPDIIEGSMSGKFKFNDLTKLMENAIGDIYTKYDPHEIEDNQFIDFNFKIYNKIAEVFYPDLELGSNTFIRGRVESDAKKFNLTFRSPGIRLNENFANNIELKLDNSNPLFNTYVEVDSIGTKYYNVSKFSLINVTLQDTLFVKSEFRGGKGNTDAYDLNLFYTINADNKSVVGFKKSDVLFKENTWHINESRDTANTIVFDRDFKSILIDRIRMTHELEEMALSGEVRDSTYKNIDLDFKNVDLIKITPPIDSLSLAGNVNGKLNIKQQNGVYLPESNMTIDGFKVNGFTLGSFKANIKGNESLTNYDVNVSLKEDDNESLSVVGNLDVSGKNSTLDLAVNFNEFILNPLNPFGEGVITDIRGQVTGNARVTGRLQRPQINGALALDDGGMRIPYLNVDYGFEDETQIRLREQSFILNNARLTDSEYFSKATMSGSVSHVNFSNWALNLDIDSDRLLVLNTDDNEDALYYGTAFVGGNVKVSGPTDQLIIKAEVESEEGTVFKIPLSDTETFGDNSYIHFLSPEEKEARLKGEFTSIEDIKGLELDFDLEVNDNAEIEIVIDKSTGSTIRGRGDGGLLVQINTNGKFNMYGDFIVNEGQYNFIYGGLIQKEFDVLPGGTLVWEGDPLQAEINIEAIYDDIQANPSILLDNPTNQSIPVEVKIHLTDRLEKPTLDFDLRFPNVNSTLNSELQYRLDDSESKQFQALSLLATGSFKSELSFDSQDAFGLVSDRATALLNELLADNEGKLQFGVNYQKGENRPDFQTDDRLGVTLTTQLSDRVLINGKVGVPIGGVNETVVAGDLEIEVLLNEDRTLALKFFNRENSIRNFGEQIGYTQGVGLSYNVEFDNLKELLQKIFKGNTAKAPEKKPEETEANDALPDFINFKKKDTVSTKKPGNF